METGGGTSWKSISVSRTKVFSVVEHLLSKRLSWGGAQASGDKASVYNLEDGKDTRACATAHKFDKNAVVVLIIDDKDEDDAGTGGGNKFTGLVRVDLTCDGFGDGGVTSLGR